MALRFCDTCLVSYDDVEYLTYCPHASVRGGPCTALEIFGAVCVAQAALVNAGLVDGGRPPFCCRCGDTRRLFLLDPNAGLWACCNRELCEHRILTATARTRALELELERREHTQPVTDAHDLAKRLWQRFMEGGGLGGV